MAHPQRIGRTIEDSTPYWPAEPAAPRNAPNVLIVLFDDVGFSDFGCYGSGIRTPAIDALATGGLRYSGFHTTAMCSTTRASLLTGRNHHSVGMGCLANFDSGYPGYRGKISKEACTLGEALRPAGYRNYFVGKWHVTPMSEGGSTGPFDGWPLGRGFDRFYGFLNAETDHYSPELVQDNTHIAPPGDYASGYHLSADLVDKSIGFIADHIAQKPMAPWLTWLAFGACHAPHQAPKALIDRYEPLFADGWDADRQRRLARQIEMGLVPSGTVLPPRNDGVRPWDELSGDERRLFVRLQAAYAAMLDHADQQIARLVEFLRTTGTLDNTIVIVMSDNGASQEGGPLGAVNTLGSYNYQPESLREKLERIETIGEPGSHSNIPHGWAMASNTPLKRYKQNTHGGGIRDPFVISWNRGIAARGEIRHQFVHACDLFPTLLDVIGVRSPQLVNGIAQIPIEGASFKASFADPDAPAKNAPQHFEMFGHRGLWLGGWKAVAYHPPGTPFEDDRWELYHLETDFSEVRDLAAQKPVLLEALKAIWWEQAEKCKVLPLDDRFGPRFAENARRILGERRRFVFHRGVGHVPTDLAPDVRSRSYTIRCHVALEPGAQGVLIAHGDATTGYSLYVKDGYLFHDLNLGGSHEIVRSVQRVPPGATTLGLRVGRLERGALGEALRSRYILLVDDEPAGEIESTRHFKSLISWSGCDIGCDRGCAVSLYEAPFPFTGHLSRVVVDLDDDQVLDGETVGLAEMGRE
ncbi:arylsulfatase [Castellaniella sp. GW247-6E4]|uniref:arylsulfatase n=1 Tax=Castellaniella sp. GW247-6E4 TaxID=3140380 RepID=UPI003314CB2D